MGGVLVEILDDERLGELRLDVLAGAALSVAAGADFEVAAGRRGGERAKGQPGEGLKDESHDVDLQRAVDFILL